MDVRANIIKADWIKKPVMLIPTDDYENMMNHLFEKQQIEFNIKTEYNEELPIFTGEIKEYNGELDELFRR